MESSPLYVRYSRFIVIAVLLLVPFLLFGAISAFLTNSNNVLDWLPESFNETRQLYQFVQKFGSDEILVVSWEGCTLEDQRLDQVATALAAPVTDPKSGKEKTWFEKVVTGRATLEGLTGKPLELPREAALERMAGWLLAPDQQTTCALATVSRTGATDRGGAIDYVRRVTKEAGIDWSVVRIGGPTANAVAIDEASNNSIAEMALGSALLGMFIAWKCLGSMRMVWILIISAVVAWGASLSTVYLSGTNMDAVLMIMPPLVFILAVSGGVHLTNYLLDASQETSSREGAVALAIRRGMLPCVLASATTAIGLGSLLSSQMIPVRKFGLYSSLGMFFIILALMIVWPAFSYQFPSTRSLSNSKKRSFSLGRWWYPLHNFSLRYSALLLVAYLLAVPVLIWGVTQIRTSVQLNDLFAPNSTPIQNTRWLEERFGSLVPVEIVLSFQKPLNEDVLALLARAELAEKLRAELADKPTIDSAIAATSFGPLLPKSTSARDLLARRVIAARLNKNREWVESIRFLDEGTDSQDWRVSTRVTADSLQQGQVLTTIQSHIDTFLASNPLPQEKVSANVSGGVPLIYMAQQQLLVDLVRSFLLAFLLIGLTMVVLVRRLTAGLLSMIPNVFPALTTFGCMGLLGRTVDIGTMMTASAAMGIAVDDTLHFLVWFRRGLSRGLSKSRAISFAYEHCATAMLQTTMICGLALLVFLVSPFAPIARFGVVMALMLGLALVGDLILLPALLQTRCGSFFSSRAKGSAEELESGWDEYSSQTTYSD